MLRKKIQHTLIYVLISFGLFFLASYRFFPLFSRIGTQASSYIVYPALVAHQQIIDPLKKWFYQRATIRELQKEIEKISLERDTLLAENIKLQATVDYFKDITELVTFNMQYEAANAKIAQVLVRHLSSQAQFFLVDLGSKHGIEVNMVAIYKNCLVGKIVEVYPWYSKVELITDSHCKIAGYCSKTSVQGIHEGADNEQYTMLSYVSHLSQVKEGDMIMSSGEGLIFPRGFALGRIDSICAEGLYHTIKAVPFIDLRQINYCTVIAKSAVK